MKSMKSEQKIKLAENLKKQMASKNLSLTSVAKKTGMNKSTLHNYCNGVVPRNLLKIKELADLFDVSLSELIFGEARQEMLANTTNGIDGKFEITIKRIGVSDNA